MDRYAVPDENINQYGIERQGSAALVIHYVDHKGSGVQSRSRPSVAGRGTRYITR